MPRSGQAGCRAYEHGHNNAVRLLLRKEKKSKAAAAPGETEEMKRRQTAQHSRGKKVAPLGSRVRHAEKRR
jgi:hypothetical protein